MYGMIFSISGSPDHDKRRYLPVGVSVSSRDPSAIQRAALPLQRARNVGFVVMWHVLESIYQFYPA